jgi:hypothetical protein
MFIDFDLFPAGTILFDQIPGVRFPTTPRVVETSEGGRAVSNAQPGEEFNTQPLRIEFTTPQTRVALRGGLSGKSSIPIQATFEAFDANGQVVATDGPRGIGPGPVPAATLFLVEVAAPRIGRVELAYSGAFSELIDDLDFDQDDAPVQPDTTPPVVTIVQPSNGAGVADESFILEAAISEDRRLREVLVTILSASGSTTFAVDPFGVPPNFHIGPFRTQPLAAGSNQVIVTAVDLSGNRGEASVSVERVGVAARLVLPDGPLVLRRLGANPVLHVRLEETFPGSLDGRGEIEIDVAGPRGIRGRALIRDFLNQPEPRTEMTLTVTAAARLGLASLFVRATEVKTGRIIATGDLFVSIVGPGPSTCGVTPVEFGITESELRAAMQAGMDEELASHDNVTALTDLSVTYLRDEIQIFRRFKWTAPVLGIPSAEINMSASIVRMPDVAFTNLQFFEPNNPELGEEELPFGYRPFRVNATPGIPLGTAALVAAWRLAESVFEARFSNALRKPILLRFNRAIYERLKSIDEVLVSLAPETPIDTREFVFRFCLPRESLAEQNPRRSIAFDQSLAAQFLIHDDPDAVLERPSSWEFDGTALVQRSNIHGPANHQNTLPVKPGTYLVGRNATDAETAAGDADDISPWPDQKDFIMECTVSTEDNDGIGLVFRYQDVDNFYFFLMDAQRRYRRIGRKLNGVFQELQNAAVDASAGFAVGVRHRLILTVLDNEFTVHIDGLAALTGTDGVIRSAGRAGFYSWGNTLARFEDVSVRPL